MYELVIGTGSFDDADLENDLAAGRARARVVPLATPQEVAAETAGADAVIVTTNRLGAAHVAALGPGVRIVGKAGIGLDAIDLAACARRGIAVVNQPDYATAEVATHAIALMLGLQRRLLESDRIARTAWSSFPQLYGMRPLGELSLGLVGTGRIGRAVADRARALVGPIRAHDPCSGPVEGIELVGSLEQLLEASDIVSLHLPLTRETTHLIDAARLARFRPGALLVNVSRGGLVDSAALVEALARGTLGGAALDVFEDEPLPAGSALARSPRTLLSPHMAWYSTGSIVRMREHTLEAVLAYLDGRPIEHGSLLPPG